MGAAFLSGFGWYGGVLAGEAITSTQLAGWAFAGALIGVAVWLCDETGPENVVSRFLALLSPLTAFFPLLGIFVAWSALKQNRHSGYYRRMALVGLWLSLVVNAAVAALVVLG